MRKMIKWAVLAVVLVIVVVVIAVYMNINRIIDYTVETQATSSLDLKTTLGGANLALFGGQLTLNELQIGSPQGYSAPMMLGLGEADVKVTFGELRQDPMHIESVELTRPKLVIERQGTKFNFQALMSQESKPPPEGEPLELIIDNLVVTGAEVQIMPGIPGLAEQITIPVPEIRLQGIGSGEGNKNGAAIKDVVMLTVTQLSAKAAQSDKLPPEVRAILAGDLKQVADKYLAEGKAMLGQELGKLTQDALKDLPADVQSKVGSALESVQRGEDPGKAVQEGLGGLLRRNQPATAPAK